MKRRQESKTLPVVDDTARLFTITRRTFIIFGESKLWSRSVYTFPDGRCSCGFLRPSTYFCVFFFLLFQGCLSSCRFVSSCRRKFLLPDSWNPSQNSVHIITVTCVSVYILMTIQQHLKIGLWKFTALLHLFKLHDCSFNDIEHLPGKKRNFAAQRN